MHISFSPSCIRRRAFPSSPGVSLIPLSSITLPYPLVPFSSGRGTSDWTRVEEDCRKAVQLYHSSGKGLKNFTKGAHELITRLQKVDWDNYLIVRSVFLTAEVHHDV